MPAPARNTQSQQLMVDPRWLLKMIALAIVAALLCAYLTLGLLFYQGAWQLALHPTHNATAGTGLSTEHVRFAPDATATPQLTGEFLAAPPLSTHSSYAVLFLRSADGQLDAADGTQISTLHDLGLNVFAFDYHGYGTSAARPHPSEAQMLQDTAAAADYLTSIRHIAPDHISLFGSGIGASLAATYATTHPAAAIVAYNTDPDAYTRIRSDARAKLFPSALIRDRFSLDALATLKTPKLIYTTGPQTSPQRAVTTHAASPKTTVEVPTHDTVQERLALSRFFDEYLR